MATAVAIAAGLVVAFLVLGVGAHSGGGGSGTVIVPAGTDYSIPAGQFDAVTFITSVPATMNGTISTAWPITLYTMTPPEFQILARTGNVEAYNWTSGTIANGSVYNIGLAFPPGSWDLVFLNPSSLNSTSIGFYTNLVLYSS